MWYAGMNSEFLYVTTINDLIAIQVFVGDVAFLSNRQTSGGMSIDGYILPNNPSATSPIIASVERPTV